MAIKPSVEGFTEEMRGTAEIVRVDIQTDAGRSLSAELDSRVVPSFVVLRPDGRVVERLTGFRGAPIPELRRAVRSASD